MKRNWGIIEYCRDCSGRPNRVKRCLRIDHTGTECSTRLVVPSNDDLDAWREAEISGSEDITIIQKTDAFPLGVHLIVMQYLSFNRTGGHPSGQISLHQNINYQNRNSYQS